LVEGSLKNRDYLIDLVELERRVSRVLERFNRALIIPRDYVVKEDPLTNIFNKIIRIERGDATLENIALEISNKIYDELKEYKYISKIILRIYEGSKYLAEIEYP